MGTKTIHQIIIVVLLLIGGTIPYFFFWSGMADKLIKRHHERKMTKLRNTAMKYIGLIHKTMIDQHYNRQQRRQFWREFVTHGRFES